MELNRYAIFSFVLACAFTANAQVSLNTASTIPAIGTEVVMHRGAFTAVPTGGADVTHDYSAVAENSVSTYKWTAPSVSPNSGMFPTADLMLNNGGNDTIFYKTSAAGIERVGETRTIDLLFANFPAGFTDPVLELPLPLTYNDTWTDGIAGTFDVDGSTGVRTGTITGTADAYGFVSIPGTVTPLQVLRTTTTVNETITITPSGLPIPVEVTHKRVEVAYRTLFSKMPVFRTVTDSLDAGFTSQVDNFSEWMDATTVGVLELQADPFALTVYPNPADGAVAITFNTAAADNTVLRVVDAQGAVVLEKPLSANGDRMERMDVKSWAPGMYQALLTGADGTRSTQRFVVAH